MGIPGSSAYPILCWASYFLAWHAIRPNPEDPMNYSTKVALANAKRNNNNSPRDDGLLGLPETYLTLPIRQLPFLTEHFTNHG